MVSVSQLKDKILNNIGKGVSFTVDTNVLIDLAIMDRRFISERLLPYERFYITTIK